MMSRVPPLRYLDAAAVEAAMPPLEERLRLAESTMVGLATGAQLPPKPAVHPRPEDAFVVKLNPSGSAFVYSTYLGGGRWR